MSPPDPEQIEEDLQEILEKLGYTSDGETFTIPFLEPLLYIILIVVLVAVLLYFIFFIVNRSLVSVGEPDLAFRRKKEEMELIHKKDYRTFYKKAVDLGKKAHYLEAVRMAYLALLLLLDAKEIIVYHPSLTNYEYRQKVRPHPFSNTFDGVTRTFDVIYYGGKSATGKDFSLCINAFTQIEEGLS